MADSRQQLIVAAIVTRLRALLIGSGGYTTSLATDSDGTRCCRDSETHWDQDTELPAISVFDMPAEVADDSEKFAGRRNVIHVMPVQIKCFVEKGTTPAAARTICQDVLKAIKHTSADANDYVYERFPELIGDKQIGLAMKVLQKRHGLERTEDTFEVEAAIVEIEVWFTTPKWEM